MPGNWRRTFSCNLTKWNTVVRKPAFFSPFCGFVHSFLLRMKNQETVVDLVDDLQMAWKQLFDHGYGPCFKRLGQDRVVRVGEDTLRQQPCLVPGQPVLVHQQPHHLRDGDGGVGVVELDCHFVSTERSKGSKGTKKEGRNRCSCGIPSQRHAKSASYCVREFEPLRLHCGA
jgi:hypothetical protein